MADFRKQGILGIDLNKEPDSEVQCTICLEQVGDESRGKAILQCGHEFHLNCIGSEFNVKGYMKCPNCRDIEWSDWLYSIASGDPRFDGDLVNWIANHHPFFVVPCGFRLCSNRGFIGPDNVPVGGQIIYGLADQDEYEEEMAPASPQQELQDLNTNYHEALSPNNQIEVTATSSSPIAINVNGSNSQSASLNDINQVNGTHQGGSSNPPNLVQIRMFGRNHQESFGFVEVPTQNPSTADTVFSGHTILGSSTQSGPDNVAVGGQIIYGGEYEEEMAPTSPEQEHQNLNTNHPEALIPNNQMEVTATSSSPIAINGNGSNSQRASLNNINQVNGTHQSGSFNPRNLVQIRLFGRNHQESFSFVEVPTQNPSTAETEFSGHTISGSSTQRVSLFNTIVTEPNSSIFPCSRGIQVPHEINREATSSPLAPAVRRAFASLTPPAGESSTITSTTAEILYLTGVTIYNPQTPVPPQDNDPQ